jgi:hypothetical protein
MHKTSILGLMAILAIAFACSKQELGTPTDSAGVNISKDAATAGLAEVLAVEWNEKDKNFVVIGLDGNGNLDAYFGNKGNFTKIQDGSDLESKFSGSEFAGFAMGRFNGKQLVTMSVGKNGTVVYGRQDKNVGLILNDRRKPQQVGTLDEILAIEWNPKHNQWVVVGIDYEDPNGKLDAYFGVQETWTKFPTWTKLKDNRDFGNWIGKNNFQDFAIGIGMDGRLDILGVMKDGRGSTGREFSNKPWMGDNQFQIETLVSCLAVDWDDENKRFVVIGEGPDGKLDAYAGDKGNWCKLQNNQDFQKWIGGPSNFADFALGATYQGTEPNQRLKALGGMKDGRGSTGRGFKWDCKLHLGDNQFQIK